MSLLLLYSGQNQQVSSDATGVAFGQASVAAVGTAIIHTIGLADGAATADAEGASTAAADGSSIGLAVVAGAAPYAVGLSIAISTAAAFQPEATGVTVAISTATAWAPIADGLSIAIASATAWAPIAVGIAAGISTAQAFTIRATGVSAGISTTAGWAPIAEGASAGASTAAGWAPIAEGISTGSTTQVVGWAPIATGFASGTASVNGHSYLSSGTAAGISTAQAFAALATAVGVAYGSGECLGYGERFFTTIGTAAGLAAASATGREAIFGGVGIVGVTRFGAGLDATFLERGLLRIARRQPLNMREFVSELCALYEQFASQANPRPGLIGRRAAMERAIMPTLLNPNIPRHQIAQALTKGLQAFWLGVQVIDSSEIDPSVRRVRGPGMVTGFLGAGALTSGLQRAFSHGNDTQEMVRQVARSMTQATRQVQYIIPGNLPGLMA